MSAIFTLPKPLEPIIASATQEQKRGIERSLAKLAKSVDAFAQTIIGLKQTGTFMKSENRGLIQIANENQSSALKHLGMGLMSLGRYEEAREKFVSSIKYNPNNYDSHVYYGAALTHLKQYEKAMTVLRIYKDKCSSSLKSDAKRYYVFNARKHFIGE